MQELKISTRTPQHGIITAAELIQRIAVISPEITSLDLSDNLLDSYTVAELRQIFSAIPPTVKSLNLSQNWYIMGGGAVWTYSF